MRNAILFILPALVLSGCNHSEGIPPADGIYTGTLQTPSGASDTIYALIDANGLGMIIDQTSPQILRFTVPPPDSSGNFSTNFTAFSGAGFGVSSGNGSSAGNTLNGTVNGSSHGIGGKVDRNTITGTISTAGATGLAFTLNYDSAAYENNVQSLATLVSSSTTGAAPSLSFQYTAAGAASGSAATTVTFTLSTTQNTNVTGSPYTFTGIDNNGCTYSGLITMPNNGYNAYEFTLSGSCNGTPFAIRSGLANYNAQNGAVPASLTLEYNDSGAFAVAANAQFQN
ncbi:MAG: hypothetical protein ACRESS_00395 [Stenotrophobium sp.]